jgi:hypothetical protein
MKKAPSMGSRGQFVRATGFWGRLRAKEVYHDVPPDEKGPALPRGGAKFANRTLCKEMVGSEASPAQSVPSLAQVRAPGERLPLRLGVALRLTIYEANDATRLRLCVGPTCRVYRHEQMI